MKHFLQNTGLLKGILAAVGVVAVNDCGGVLQLFCGGRSRTESVWNGQMDLLRQRLNRWNAEHQQIFRQFVSDVELISLDGNGRFLIPKRYLKLANIEQGIKFIGMGDTIEIWRNAPESQSFMSSEEFGKALQEVMRDTQQTVDGQ